MATTFNGRRKVRKSFGSIREVTEMPNLIEVQKASYDQFLLVDEPKGGRRRRGAAGRLQVGLPDHRLFQHRLARIREVRVRAAQVRRRRVPAARYDLRCAAQGDAAPDRVRSGRGNRRPLRQGHQGAGRLHGRHAVHDHERHLHRQRHRARHRLADAPFAGRVLRPRQGQDPFVGQAAVCRPHHSVPRLVARHRVRRQGHRLCAHRPPPQDSGDVAAQGARHGCRGDPRAPTTRRSTTSGTRRVRLEEALRRRVDEEHQADLRPDRCQDRQGRARGRQEAHRPPGQEARRPTA